MRFWREALADRSSGGMLGVLLALALGVQVATAGFAFGGMAGVDAHVVCTAASAAADDRDTGGNGQERECPLAVFCRAAAAAAVHLPTQPPAVACRDIRTSARVAFGQRREGPGAPVEGLAPDARGPPLLSA